MIFSILRLKPFNFLRSPQSDHLSRSTILCTLLIFIGIWPGFLTPTGLGFSCWEGSFYLANSFSPWWIWFALHKSAFQDALALHNGWLPLPAPTHCACGTSFFVEHALSCPKGVLASIHHNEISDLTATLLTEVCLLVATEPELQPVPQEDFSFSITNVQDSVRLDIIMNGFWEEGQSVHLLMSVFLIHLLHQDNQFLFSLL